MTTVCESFHYISLDDVVDSVTNGCYFAVVDIKSGYCSVNIAPAHRPFQGFKGEIEG